jgi:yecA family protein
MSTQDETMPLDFDECCNQMLEFGYEVSPSELHGLLSGVVCTGLKIRPESVINLVLKHVDVETCSERNRETILAMYEFIEREMFSADSRYTLFLPDDELDMTQRLRSLAAWCQGYLVGFGTASAQTKVSQFSAETEEALKDIVNISNLSDDFGAEEEETNEAAYAELVEYLKVAVLLMSSEMLAATEKDG